MRLASPTRDCRRSIVACFPVDSPAGAGNLVDARPAERVDGVHAVAGDWMRGADAWPHREALLEGRLARVSTDNEELVEAACLLCEHWVL